MIARLIIVLLSTTSYMYGQTPAQLLGRWQIKAIPNASPITGLSDRKANSLIGRYLILNRHTLKFAGESCEPTYAREKQTTAEFIEDYKIDPKTLGLSDPIVRIDGDCTDIFLTKSGRIIFTWDGFFLEATRSPSK